VTKYGKPASRRQFASDLLARVEAIPGVEGAALASVVPAAGWNPMLPFEIENQPEPDPARRPRTGDRVVSTAFFEAMQIPITRGRSFSAADQEDGQPVAIVSAAFADRYWPGQDPTGKRLRVDDQNGEWLTVVGVAGDVRMYNWWDGENPVVVYRPLRQAPPAGLVYAVVRAQGEPGSIAPSIREAVRSVDSLLPVTGVRTMPEAVADSSAGLRHMALLMGICGSIGLVLALVGIFSVMSYAVSQRTHEFGIRMALGATAPELLRMTLGQAGALTGLGLALGSVMALAFGRVLESALFGAIPLQLAPFLAVSVALAIVSLAAACLPARRTLQLDPATILRER
jgi:predicted permease